MEIFTNIPRRFAVANFKDIPENQEKIVLRKWLNSPAPREQEGIGLLLTGVNDSGKTYTACAILNELSREKQSNSIKFLYIEDLKGISAGDHDLKKRIGTLEQIKNIRYLCVDEVGKGFTNEKRFLESEFSYLIRYRVHNLLPTILTSNESLQNLREMFGKSLFQLIAESFLVVEYTESRGFRKMNKDKIANYFYGENNVR